MTKESFIKELIEKKEKIKKLNFNKEIPANYNRLVEKVIEELDKLPLGDFKSLFPKAFSKLTEDLESISLYINIDIENSNFSEEVAIKEYSKFAETYLNFGWVCTDLDRKQYGKKLDESHYVFKEFDNKGEYYEDKWIELDILLSHYDEDKINNHISSYYDSVDQIKEIYGDHWEWIVAECIFEQESGLY